jgi:hypothetical protein
MCRSPIMAGTSLRSDYRRENRDLALISVRHEALLFRMEVEDRPSPRRRSGGVKLRAA